MNNGILDGLHNILGFTTETWRSLSAADYEPVQSTGSGPGSTQSWPASANTLTGWIEIVPSSPFDCCAIDVVITSAGLSANDTSCLFDIATGPSGSEVVIIDGIPIYGHTSPQTIRFPIRIPAGTRLAWRFQSAATSVTITATPAVGIGFIKDIPEFPAGTSVATVGTQNRAASTYTNIAIAAATGQRKAVWATVGTLPAGKTIYLIPMAVVSSAAAQPSHSNLDWGWIPDTGLAINTAVPGPREIWAAETIHYMTSQELLDPHNPTVWIPNGYPGGSVVVATDQASALFNKFMCFAIVE